jgi:glucokinase
MFPNILLLLQAVDIFLSIIGAEAGAMALRCLARGGVFIAGGIVPRLMERVKSGAASASPCLFCLIDDF